MTPSTRPRSATKFDSAAATPPSRPTTPIPIGSQTYIARAPKIDVWREVTKMLSTIDLVRTWDDDDRSADASTEADYDALLVELADVDRLESAIVTGVTVVDDDGKPCGIEGGFLRRCLSKEDWAKVRAEWKDDDSDLDLDHLFTAARNLQDAFSDWFQGREAAMGIPSAEVKPPARKPKPKQPAARSR